jgi:hypothetical protein
MRNTVAIEDIEEMRRREGIDDVELREGIRGLRVGDSVRLTLLTGAPAAGETLLVRITRIRGRAFRGRLVARPASARLAPLQAGSLLDFTATHIHSLPRGPRAQEHGNPGRPARRLPRSAPYPKAVP